jgi:hypothetical protein
MLVATIGEQIKKLAAFLEFAIFLMTLGAILGDIGH